MAKIGRSIELIEEVKRKEDNCFYSLIRLFRRVEEGDLE